MSLTKWKSGAGVLLLVGVLGCGSSQPVRDSGASRYAVTGSVTGEDGTPLEFASVALVGSPLGSVTDRNGEFGFGGIREGDYGLTVIYLGYRSSPMLFRVRGPVQQTVALLMSRDPSLGEAKVDSLPPIKLSYQLEKQLP